MSFPCWNAKATVIVQRDPVMTHAEFIERIIDPMLAAIERGLQKDARFDHKYVQLELQATLLTERQLELMGHRDAAK